ncbi:MAG TPA: hypothetical protein ENJ82_10035 [Bacteroidetes bacterium]|nr:hypothetical protein [Bacteroidota bacterium]
MDANDSPRARGPGIPVFQAGKAESRLALRADQGNGFPKHCEKLDGRAISLRIGAFCSLGNGYFEIAAFPLPGWRQSRKLIFILLVTFHLTNLYLFSIGIFPLVMAFLTLLYIPEWFRLPGKPATEKPAKNHFSPPHPIGAGVLSAFFFSNWPCQYVSIFMLKIRSGQKQPAFFPGTCSTLLKVARQPFMDLCQHFPKA